MYWKIEVSWSDILNIHIVNRVTCRERESSRRRNYFQDVYFVFQDVISRHFHMTFHDTFEVSCESVLKLRLEKYSSVLKYFCTSWIITDVLKIIHICRDETQYYQYDGRVFCIQYIRGCNLIQYVTAWERSIPITKPFWRVLLL